MKLTLKSNSLFAGASVALALVVVGCIAVDEAAAPEEATVVEEAVVEAAETIAEPVQEQVVEMTSAETLAAILGAQPEEVQARYGARNPAETLAFFGIEPGMKVAEALPGGGWYSKILLGYWGEEGTLIGAHYPDDLWGRFGFGDEWTATRVAATANWPSATD